MNILTKNLLHWFSENKRDLPWRKTYDPYQVWISEIMLQQTQMERVVPFFRRWLEHFPGIEDVAMASEDDVLKAWEGLGYYSRARNIVKCARVLVENYQSSIPACYEDLITLPGIGPYTGGAIMSIAFNREYPVVDANIKRVFARVYNISTPRSSANLKDFCNGKALELLPKGKAREFNQALMELGALICQPKDPACDLCPLADDCESRKSNIVHLRPVPNPQVRRTSVSVVAGVIVHKGEVYIQKRLPHMRWGNLWEFPGGHLEPGESPEEALKREIREETEFGARSLSKIGSFQHSFTRYDITLHAFSCKLDTENAIPVLHAAQEYKWLPLERLATYTFSSGHRKLLHFMLKQKV